MYLKSNLIYIVSCPKSCNTLFQHCFPVLVWRTQVPAFVLSKAYNRIRGSSHSYICDSFYFNPTHFAFSHWTVETLSQDSQKQQMRVPMTPEIQK